MENNAQSQETINKLQPTLASREKQIASMATMLAELNEKLNDVEIFHSLLKFSMIVFDKKQGINR